MINLIRIIRYKLRLFYSNCFFFFHSLLLKENIKAVKVILGKNFVLDISGSGFSIRLDAVIFSKYCSIKIRKSGNLVIGNGTYFNDRCSISCMSEIEIGENVLFGEGVKLYDHNHKFRDKSILIAKQGFSVGKIKIGSNSWIGSNVVVLRNVTIGENVVIGAGCVISKNIPSNTLVKSGQPQIIENY